MTGTAHAKKHPRRSIMFAGHHEKPITDELAWALIRQFRHGRSLDGSNDRPFTDKDEEEQFQVWKGRPERNGLLSFLYPRPHQPGSPLHFGNAGIWVALRPAHQMRLDNNQVAYIRRFEQEKANWFTATALGARIDSASPFEMAWLIDKLLLTLPVLEPDFCFADVESRAVKHLDDDPYARVWPVMIYGQGMVNEHGGREKLLETPAWRVDELSSGRILIQVAENPFAATTTQLKKAAMHLDLSHNE